MIEIIQQDVAQILVDLTPLRNKTILITGASGLIGLYLVACIKAVAQEYNITLFTWHKNPLQPEVASLFNHHCLIGDITDINLYAELPQLDYIIHAAGYGQPGKFMANKLKTIELNTVATDMLFHKLKANGTLLFVSTSEVYSGLEDQHTENDIGTTTPSHPRACYIEGKRCGEAICHAYRDQGYNVKIARLSLAYGPGTQKNDARVLNSVIQKAITQDTITLMDAGSAIRTYCYITDVIEMFWNIFLHSQDHTYNVGGNSTLTILELAQMIGAEFQKDVVTPAISQELSGSPQIVNMSIAKYCQEFKKQNFVSMSQGLKRTIEWQKNMYNYGI